jgi:hypothetical protein
MSATFRIGDAPDQLPKPTRPQKRQHSIVLSYDRFGVAQP